jgi:hypothetical protein
MRFALTVHWNHSKAPAAGGKNHPKLATPVDLVVMA